VLRGRKVVAKLVGRRKAGRGSLVWNGKIKRRRASSGNYKIRVRAVSAAGTSARDSATLRLVTRRGR